MDNENDLFQGKTSFCGSEETFVMDVPYGVVNYYSKDAGLIIGGDTLYLSLSTPGNYEIKAEFLEIINSKLVKSNSISYYLECKNHFVDLSKEIDTRFYKIFIQKFDEISISELFFNYIVYYYRDNINLFVKHKYPAQSLSFFMNPENHNYSEFDDNIFHYFINHKSIMKNEIVINKFRDIEEFKAVLLKYITSNYNQELYDFYMKIK